MKIIALTANFATDSPTPGQYYMMADSSLLKDSKPFYVPDFASDFRAYPSLVVRTSRLGKTIGARFGRRYYDAVAAGVALRAEDEYAALRRAGLPTAPAVAFDGSAVIGRFVTLQPGQAASDFSFSLCSDKGASVRWDACKLCFSAEEVIAEISRRFTIKMGDLVYIGLTPEGIPLCPGMRLSVQSENLPLFEFNIK